MRHSIAVGIKTALDLGSYVAPAARGAHRVMTERRVALSRRHMDRQLARGGKTADPARRPQPLELAVRGRHPAAKGSEDRHCTAPPRVRATDQSGNHVV